MDITVHEVMEGGHLKELHKASGGAWGGTKVDDAFHKLLVDIVGKCCLNHFLSWTEHDIVFSSAFK